MSSGLNACIFGASGALGAAFVAALAGRGDCACIHAGSRSGALPAGCPVDAPVVPFAFDLADEASIARAAAAMAERGPLHLVIVATGLLHRPGGPQPEKSWTAIDAAALAELFAVNATGPALIARHVLPLLDRERRSVFAAISARVGSIGDNRLGGWYGYRASKAALNALVHGLAIELARRNPRAIAVTLHPGTVGSALSAPFSRNVAPASLQTPAASAQALLRVLDGLGPKQSGGFYAWDGQPIPW